MVIEKVFAIDASPETIWEALWSDLSEGDSGGYALEGSGWPSRLELQVELGGVVCHLLYRIEQKRPGQCEVSATLTPLSRRYSLFYALTFGHVKRNYELLLAAGLANLKASVEAKRGSAGEATGEDAMDSPE